MRSTSKSLIFLLVVLTVQCLAAAAAENPATYIVGPNDTLTISVYDQPQLTGKYRVEADGTFTFPLIGRVKVGGLSMQAIEGELRERLAKGYLKNPQVAVSVEDYRSQQIFVMGEVKQPGSLQFTGAMTVIEALARVGSTTEQAGQEAVIIRPLAGGPAPEAAVDLETAQHSNNSEVIRVDLQSLQTGALSQNTTLRGGDTVFVPRAASVFVSGFVVKSGEYPIRKGTTVRQVLAMAGGVAERGSTGRIQIIRKVDGQERTISVNQQDPVMAGDTIVVRERLF
jgi:polysaccharide export outer membrane protein